MQFIEFIGGWLTNSTAIMADAVHDLGDTLSIGSAWLLNKLGTKSATKEFTYGYRRLSLLGALINGIVLIVGSAWILYEAVPRLSNPEMPETEGMINQENIAKMKDGVMIVNTSRGQLINEADLTQALNDGKVAGAAVDVVSTEPITADNPLLQAKNMIITPHIAWASKEARSRLMDIAVENATAFIAGKPINVVNA